MHFLLEGLKAKITDDIGQYIRSVSWEYSCDEEHFEEFDKGKILKYSLLQAVLPRNRLDPNSVCGIMTYKLLTEIFE